MEKKLKPLNYWGESFWRRHLYVFGFIKYFFCQFIDFLEDKMHIPELSVAIAGIYLISLNVNLLGIYKTFALCQPHYPDYINVPGYLLIENKFSLYSHHLYPLVFIGNLRSVPFFITLSCAFYCFYDFSLIAVDVFTI